MAEHRSSCRRTRGKADHGAHRMAAVNHTVKKTRDNSTCTMSSGFTASNHGTQELAAGQHASWCPTNVCEQHAVATSLDPPRTYNSSHGVNTILSWRPRGCIIPHKACRPVSVQLSQCTRRSWSWGYLRGSTTWCCCWQGVECSSLGPDRASVRGCPSRANRFP
jgi:hypothetical protein